MKTRSIVTISGLSILLAGYDASALSGFVSRIPNGTVFSCSNCHAPSGPPALNPFGNAFLSAGFAWGPGLAALDSDGDGFTNGEELGDPDGNGVPTAGAQVTNPGDANSHPNPVVAPTITTQPASQTVTAGANVTFSVVAAGTAPLSYQWQKNTVNISGATAATLTLNNVSAGDAGSYRVMVTNVAGSVTSAAATLTVNPAPVPPTITTQPTSQTVTVGANVTFSVVATGTAPLTYQWRKNTVNISGATSATLALNNVSAGDAGSYSVIVSNVAGTVTSSAATLTVNPVLVPPAITTQPTSLTVTAGGNATFNVVATGTAPLSYQWQKNTVSISGATSATLTLNNVSAGDAGSYRVVVTNVAGSVTSAAATLTVNPVPVAPAITQQPAGQTVTAGANVSFSVVATGTAPLSYQWQRNAANIAGATSATLMLNNVSPTDAGDYRAIIANAVGSVTSVVATLIVSPAPVPPAITQQPASQSVTAGANVSFSVVAIGTAPLNYQWQKNTVNIPGATSATLTLNNVSATDGGSYRVILTNTVGSVTSAAATLTVNPAPVPPTITQQPVSQSVTAGANVTFSVVATGTAPLSYQWQKDGTNLAGATSTTLTRNNVSAADAGTYRVIVNNVAGTLTSADAVLTVNPVPTSLTLTSPTNGAVFNAPATFPLTAAVPLTAGAQSVGGVALVEFFQDSIMIGAFSGPPFSINVVNLVGGNYAFTARATDLAGITTTSAPVNITVNGPPPPTGPSVVTVTATDPDASEMGPDPGAFQVTRTGDTTGPLTVYYLPGGTTVNGEDYQMIPEMVTIPAGATSASIPVLPILDQDSPTELSDVVILQLVGPPAGQPGYTIGSPASAVVTITESTNLPPTVRIVNPQDGARFSVGRRGNAVNVVLVAQPTDSDGTVASVEFFSGTQSLGFATLAPGATDDDVEPGEGSGSLYVLVLRGIPVGQYVVTAQATDNLGATTVSAPVHFSVVRGRTGGDRDRERSND